MAGWHLAGRGVGAANILITELVLSGELGVLVSVGLCFLPCSSG